TDSGSRRVTRIHSDLGTDINIDVRHLATSCVDPTKLLPKNWHSRVAVARHPIINSRRKALERAKISSDGLCRQPFADLPVYRPIVASMAIPVATTTFQGAPPARPEFCALDSRLRHCSSRNVAHPNRNRDLDATATRRVIELDSPSNVGRSDRNVPFDGLCLLVVALGHAHGAVFLAIPQRASHRSGSGCEHGRAISLRRNDPFHRLSLVSRAALRYRPDHAGRVLRQF